MKEQVDHERIVLQDEERRLASALSSVRSLLNSLTPISSLPPEILDQVFQICVGWLADYHRPKHALAWSQVCRLWRCIALSSSRLWRRIDFANPRYAEVFLARSRDVPLSLISNSPSHLRVANIETHSSRWHTVNLYLRREEMTALFSSPHLQLNNLVDVSLKIPPSLDTLHLRVALPAVRSLSLDGISIPWDQCQDLTLLAIRGIEANDGPSLSQIRAILQRSPNLTSLRLQSCLHYDASDSDVVTINAIEQQHHVQVQGSSTIKLPHITDIMISSKPPIVSAFFRNIRVSSSSKIQLHSSLTDSLHSLLPHGLPYISLVGDGVSESEALGSSTMRLSTCSFTISSQQSSTSPSTQRNNVSVASTSFSIASASALPLSVFDSFHYTINPTSITTLELTTGMLEHLGLRPLREMLSHLENLQTMQVDFNNLTHLFEVLGMCWPVPGSGRFICPVLKEITFGRTSYTWRNFALEWMPSVVGLARERKFHDVPLEKITFTQQSSIPKSTLTELERYVGSAVVASSGWNHW